VSTFKVARPALTPTDIAWVGLVGYVLVCNLILKEMLSEAADRYLVRHHWLTETALLAIYLHLSNRVPARYDPLHGVFLVARSFGIRVGLSPQSE
jgi:hypothetical protein